MGRVRDEFVGRGRFSVKRRWILGVGCASLFATLAPRGVAETEVEVAAYGGQSEGAWNCGPRGRARYGGLGGQVRFSDHRATAQRGRGGTIVVGADVEYEQVKIEPDGDASHARSHFPDTVHAGMGARFGDDWRLFGFGIGLQGFSAWGKYDDRKPSAYLLPQLELRAGPQNVAWVTAGVGSPLVTTYRRPGAYIGAGAKLELHEFDLCFGSFRSGPAGFDEGSTRLDLVWKFPAWRGWGPRVGGSVSSPDKSPGTNWEASLGIAARL